MENKIKVLYIITIISIMAFLCMQGWWLYGRYGYSLAGCEKATVALIENAVRDYRAIRSKMADKVGEDGYVYTSNFNVDESCRVSDSTQDVKATLTIKGYKISNVVGKSKSDIDENDMKAFYSKIAAGGRPDSVNEKVYELKGISRKVDVMDAMSDVALDSHVPFTLSGIDALLKKRGIEASTVLVSTDSLIWSGHIVKNASPFDSEMTYLFPYNSLECRAVSVSCRIPADEVIGSMLWTFILSLTVSLMLVVCLIWQISTIARLNRIDKTRRSFIQTMVHELKRPLSTLKMCISALDNDKMMAEETVRHEMIGESRRAINNLAAYFSRLRDITYNEAGQIPLDIETCDLKEIVASEIAKTDLPSGKDVEIKDVSVGRVELACDRMHISQMIRNLIENAVKYSGDSVEIKVDCRRKDDCVEISVADNGYGISESDCVRVFDKFYRTRSASDSDKPGVGLGLAYVKLLAEAHGGTVAVKSREGSGSLFTIIIPQ